MAKSLHISPEQFQVSGGEARPRGDSNPLRPLRGLVDEASEQPLGQTPNQAKPLRGGLGESPTPLAGTRLDPIIKGRGSLRKP